MIIESLYAILGFRTEGEQDMNRFRQGLRETGQAMQTLGRNMTLGVTVPLVGFATSIARVAGNFEASMNRVGAALGIARDTESFNALEEAAKRLGETTSFSATEAADAIEILAKNGLDAADILGGTLDASLALAASSGANLADAGDIATDVMLQFGKSAAETGDVVDGITGVLLESKFGIDDYRLALAQAGGVAGGTGVSFEDFNAAIAATSSMFASGSDAGTSFKTFLTTLVPTTSEAEGAIKEFGLEFFDAQGNMRSMAEIAQELQDGLSGLSEEARNEALKTIFGQDAMRTAIGLMNEGAAGIDRIAEAIEQASAAEQAAARMEGFNGQMRAMASAFEAVQLALADTGILQAFTSMITKLAEALRAIAAVNPELLKLGVYIAGAAAVIGPAIWVLGGLVTALSALSWPVVLAAAAFAGLIAVVSRFWPEIKAAYEQVKALFEEGGLEAVFAAAKNRILAFWDGVDWTQLGTAVAAGIGAGMAGAGDWIVGWVSSLKAQIDSVDWSQIGSMVARAIFDFVVDASVFITRLFESMSSSADGADWSAIGAVILAGILSFHGAVREFVAGFFAEMVVAFGEVDWTELGLIVGRGILNGIKAVGGAIAGFLKSQIRAALGDTVSSFIGLGAAEEDAAAAGARASGGPVRAGATYRVNERGEEFFTPGRSGFITPHDRSMEAIAGIARSAAGYHSTTNVGDIHVHAPTREAADIGRAVRGQIDQVRSLGSTANPHTP